MRRGDWVVEERWETKTRRRTEEGEGKGRGERERERERVRGGREVEREKEHRYYESLNQSAIDSRYSLVLVHRDQSVISTTPSSGLPVSTSTGIRLYSERP